MTPEPGDGPRPTPTPPDPTPRPLAPERTDPPPSPGGGGGPVATPAASDGHNAAQGDARNATAALPGVDMGVIAPAVSPPPSVVPDLPDSRNRYAYGQGDPVNTWDPDGKWGIGLLIRLGGAAAAFLSRVSQPAQRALPAIPRAGQALASRVSPQDVQRFLASVRVIRGNTVTTGLGQYTLDSRGRVTQFIGIVRPGALRAGSTIKADARNWVKAQTGSKFGRYESCHILAKLLGGVDSLVSMNVMPCLGTVNRGGMKTMERRLANWVENNQRSAPVQVKMIFNRGNKTSIPDRIEYYWREGTRGRLHEDFWSNK